MQCPLCNNNLNLTQFDSFTIEDIANSFTPRHLNENAYSALLHHLASIYSESCSRIYCSNCQFLYAHPFIAGDSTFYKIVFNDRDFYPSEKWEYNYAVDFLKHHNANNLSVLEIGAGSGEFIKKILGSLSTKDRILATDFSQGAIERLSALGIEAYCEDIRTLLSKNNLQKRNFDVICFFQVLEHLDDITNLINFLTQHLNPNGHFIISVPNDKFINFSEKYGALLDLPPNHISRWSEESFRSLCKSTGLKLKACAISNESYLEKIKRYLLFHYLKKCQNSQSLAAKIERQKRSIPKYILKRIYILISSIFLLYPIIKLFSSNLGEARCAILSRE